MTRRMGIGTSAVAAGRLFGIPASNIRKWVHRRSIHTYRDGSIDVACLKLHLMRRELTHQQRTELHDAECQASKRGTPADLSRRSTPEPRSLRC